MPIALAFAVLLAAPEVQRAIDPGQLEHRPSLIDAVKLRRSHADAHGTPAQRDHFLREHRRWLADRLAGLCASGDESACADALLALADLERFELSIAEPAPFETRPCPASLDHAGCASRVLAPGYRILLGPLVFEFIAGERGELQLLAGRFAEQGESIALLREQSLASPALAECARRAAALPPLDIQFEEDPNIDPELLRSFDRGLKTNSSLEGKSPAVLCMDESHGRFHLLAHEQPAAASENSDGWLVRRHRYDTPCRGLGWMLTFLAKLSSPETSTEMGSPTSSSSPTVTTATRLR